MTDSSGRWASPRLDGEVLVKPGEGGEPIGSYSDPFNGHFDGQGYTIANLTINRPEQDYVGLFGALQGALVENLTLAGADISGHEKAGSLAGSALSAVIEHCTTGGEVMGCRYVGSLLGHLDSSSVISCSGCGEVRGSGQVGGLVGPSNYGTFIQCHAEGVVKAEDGWAECILCKYQQLLCNRRNH